MPSKPMKHCAVPGCPGLAPVGTSYCDIHRQEREAGKRRAYDARRASSARRGYGQAWRAIRAGFLQEHPKCERCGDRAAHVHHRLPLKSGGTNAWENLQALCAACHNKMHPERGRRR